MNSNQSSPVSSSPASLAHAVRVLNAHHMATCAGFYGSRIGGRYFRARVQGGAFQVYDFEVWTTVKPEDMVFHDHNGQGIELASRKERDAARRAAKASALRGQE